MMFGKVPVGVAGYERDDPVVLRVDLVVAELLDLLEQLGIRRVEAGEDLADVSPARSRDNVRVDVVRLGAWAFRLSGRAEMCESVDRQVEPRGDMRDEILIGPSRRRLRLQTGKADRQHGQAERDPRAAGYVGELFRSLDGRAPLRE